MTDCFRVDYTGGQTVEMSQTREAGKLTTASVNLGVVSGEVRKLFEKRQTAKGTSQVSFSLSFRNNGGYERQIIVQVYGQKADDLTVDEGDTVLVQYALDEMRWQDKATEEWLGRHDIVASSVVNVAQLEEGGGALDD